MYISVLGSKSKIVVALERCFGKLVTRYFIWYRIPPYRRRPKRDKNQNIIKHKSYFRHAITCGYAFMMASFLQWGDFIIMHVTSQSTDYFQKLQDP